MKTLYIFFSIINFFENIFGFVIFTDVYIYVYVSIYIYKILRHSNNVKDPFFEIE